jgi:hypothetical protein
LIAVRLSGARGRYARRRRQQKPDSHAKIELRYQPVKGNTREDYVPGSTEYHKLAPKASSHILKMTSP